MGGSEKRLRFHRDLFDCSALALTEHCHRDRVPSAVDVGMHLEQSQSNDLHRSQELRRHQSAPRQGVDFSNLEVACAHIAPKGIDSGDLSDFVECGINNLLIINIFQGSPPSRHHKILKDL
jgi:hypothetical protein